MFVKKVEAFSAKEDFALTNFYYHIYVVATNLLARSSLGEEEFSGLCTALNLLGYDESNAFTNLTVKVARENDDLEVRTSALRGYYLSGSPSTSLASFMLKDPAFDDGLERLVVYESLVAGLEMQKGLKKNPSYATRLAYLEAKFKVESDYNVIIFLDRFLSKSVSGFIKSKPRRQVLERFSKHEHPNVARFFESLLASFPK